MGFPLIYIHLPRILFLFRAQSTYVPSFFVFIVALCCQTSNLMILVMVQQQCVLQLMLLQTIKTGPVEANIIIIVALMNSGRQEAGGWRKMELVLNFVSSIATLKQQEKQNNTHPSFTQTGTEKDSNFLKTDLQFRTVLKFPEFWFK